MKNILFTIVAIVLVLNTQAFAKGRNDMPFICKYEGKINFGVSQSSVQTLPVERVQNRYVIYAQTPKNTQRALFFECVFNKRGEFIRIKRTRDMRKGNSAIPRSAKRSCKGEASSKWGIRHPNNIKINKAVKVGGDDYMINVSGQGNRGKCEVSGNGRIYMFQTTSGGHNNGNNAGQNNGLKNAVKACKKEAQKRWRMTSSEIGADKTRKLGRNDYMVSLSARGHAARCEASGNGRIYLFSK